MSFRFQRRIKILPGLRLNVSKTGFSWTVGTRGASVTARDGKLTGNVGIPGTGLSYRRRLDLPSEDEVDQDQPRLPPVTSTPSWLMLAAVVDFTFNLGAGRLQTSTLRRRINQRDWAAAANVLGRWVYGGGRVLPGLVARQEAEINVFLG
uniref:DUF4236 domain-containing protein n=1 Tax=Rheinheimera sp. TaxID=1869214 RepID=UPI004048563C